MPSLLVWMVAASWEATKSWHDSRPPAGLKTVPALPPTHLAYLLGQPVPFLLSPIHRGHLLQVPHSQLGLAVEEEPAGGLWQPPGTKRRMKSDAGLSGTHPIPQPKHASFPFSQTLTKVECPAL